MNDTIRRYVFTKNVRFIASAAAGVFFAWLFSSSYLGRTIELSTYNLRLKYAHSYRQPDTSIVILTIDQNSLQYFKKRHTSWPWPRDFYAIVTRYVMNAGAKAMVYDFHFNEPDEDRVSSSGADNDRQFADAMREGRHVHLGAQLTTLVDDDQEGDTIFYAPSGVRMRATPEYVFNKTYAPLPEFQQAAAGVGVVNFFPDEDGTCRRVPLVYEFAGRPLYTLSYQVFADLHPKDSLQLASPFLIYYYGMGGPGGVFKYYSIHHVIVNAIREQLGQKTDLSPSVFKDKIVFVGSNAAGLLDLRDTPYTSEAPYPGVEIHATALSNFLQGHVIHTTPVAAGWAIAFCLAIIIALIATYDLHVWIVSVYTAGIVVVYWAVAFEIFARLLVWLPIVFPAGTAFLTFVIALGWSYATEGRAKRQMQKMFGRYVNPHIVTQLAASPDDAGVSGVEVEATVLFSDIEGFTSISETKTPSELVAFLNNYFGEATKLYLKHNGTIDKFIGDAVMVLFGAPVKSEDHALQACRSAYEFYRNLQAQMKTARERGEPVFSTRIGINSGKMTVGSIGSSLRMEYTAIGDPVNLASRLEGVNKFYGTSLMVSEYTAAGASKEFVLRELDLIRVKGKQHPIKIYEIVCRRDEATPELMAGLELFHEALCAYRNQQWPEAIALFTKTAERIPDDPPSRAYISRCREFQEQPLNKEWDGVYTMKAK
ncbi:MAG TPA: adenylate/guanylate cyclase domain-containing protein [Bacteroidota bacterium]|nr:adenylate/guanylate cyclase domain-containing protein [Bacteroidota bacterium]